MIIQEKDDLFNTGDHMTVCVDVIGCRKPFNRLSFPLYSSINAIIALPKKMYIYQMKSSDHIWNKIKTIVCDLIFYAESL